MAKFKFHWGWGILLVYITFMSVFLFFFYKSFGELKTNELVTEDYYEKELVYGDVLDKKQHADTMKVQLQIIPSEQGVKIVFPHYLPQKKIEGKVILYKPNKKALDQVKEIILDENNEMLINRDNFISGRWNVIVDWKMDSIPYFREQKISIK